MTQSGTFIHWFFKDRALDTPLSISMDFTELYDFDFLVSSVSHDLALAAITKLILFLSKYDATFESKLPSVYHQVVTILLTFRSHDQIRNACSLAIRMSCLHFPQHAYLWGRTGACELLYYFVVSAMPWQSSALLEAFYVLIAYCPHNCKLVRAIHVDDEDLEALVQSSYCMPKILEAINLKKCICI